MIEQLEKLLENVKEEYAKYTEKKSFGTRKDVRKALQALKTKVQEMRVWMLEDFK